MKTKDSISNTKTICWNAITKKHETHYFPNWIYKGFVLGQNNELTVKEVIDENTKGIQTRLEELRTEIRNECISYSELAELESLSAYIKEGDVELLEWAGVTEG